MASGCHRELLGASTVVWSTFECLEKHTKFNISAQKMAENWTCSV